jgi:outer membrane protein assembly factor BamB
VLEEPALCSRVTGAHRVEAACCALRLGYRETACQIFEGIDQATTVKIAGRSAPLSRWLRQLATFDSAADDGQRVVTVKYRAGEYRTGESQVDHAQSRSSGVVVALANSDESDAATLIRRNDRAPSIRGSPPALGHVLWRGSLAGEQSRHLQALASAWETYQLQNGLPTGTAQLPLLVDDRLVYRDFEGLRAVDVRSGKTLWFHPCTSALYRDISPRQTTPADGNPDPNNVMRLVVGNCTLQTLSSDSRHVFAVDRAEPEELATAAPSTANGDAAAPRPPCNVLAAFELEAEGLLVAPKWIVGGREEGRAGREVLTGHCFLGPPLCVADRLFTVSERRQQLYLSCLKSETGDLIWTQAICSVLQPIEADYQRLGMACLPTYAEGVVVCPTQAGVLVAVDSLSGTLLWAASHDDDEPQLRQQMSSWPYSARRKYAHPGYSNLPVVHRSNVLYLPAHSEYIHCLDLAKGGVRWRTRREDAESSTATEYVAAVTDATVVLIGRRKCRGLAIDSGKERWEVRLGSSPAGQGVHLAGSYHVPLDDGRIISLELDSGRQSGTVRAAPQTGAAGSAGASAAARPLGNLVAGRDLIVSMRPGEISVFPQAHVVLEDLYAKLKDKPHDSETALDIADLEMTLGQLDRAEPRLEHIRQQRSGTQAAAHAEELLRELLVRKIHRDAGPTDAEGRAGTDGQTGTALDRLAILSIAPENLGKYLLERCSSIEDGANPQARLAAARELATGASHIALEANDDPSRSAAGHVLAAELLRRMGRADEQSRRFFSNEIAEAVSTSLKSGDAAAVLRLIDLQSEAALADGFRLRLAQLLIDQGQLQRAEIVLLTCRPSRLSAIAGQSTRMLAELWSKQGLHQDAARLFVELATQFADVEVAPQQQGAAWLARFPRDQQSFESYRALAKPHWSGTGARIQEERLANEGLQTIYNGNGIQYLSTPRPSPFDLFDRGRGANGVFAVVNRHTGSEYPETIRVPGRVFYPATMQPGHVQHSFVGNFFPLGGMGALYGVSLLERKLLWTTIPKALENVKDVVRVGPAGPRFCTFQHRQHLFVVDPVDGHILWQRDDLEAASGLMHESFLGIIGDDRVLVVFASNNANYTVYDTACGAELRRGKLDIQHRLTRRAIGRRLFHSTASAATRRLRVWDPLDDSYAWDEPASQVTEVSVLEGVPPGTKVLAFVRDTDEAAYVTNTGHIRVVNLINGQERLDIAVEPDVLDNVSRLCAFRDHDRYFFNLQRSTCKPGTPETHIISDALLPCAHVDGELCAVDATTRKMLWRRSLGRRSILQLPGPTLPALVSICRIREQEQSYLSVELLDVQSGETLATRKDLLSDRLVQTAYDRQGGLIELRGAKTVIRLEFPQSVARLDAVDPQR